MAPQRRQRGGGQGKQSSQLQQPQAASALDPPRKASHEVFSPAEPAAGLTLSVHPVWLEIPFVQGELFFECTLFLYSVLALFLQYLNLYKTLWWLPKSYWHYSMKLHHINPYFLSCVGLLLGLRVTKCFWNTMSELVMTWTEGASLGTRRFFTLFEYAVVKLPVMAMIFTSFFFSFSRILREFPGSSVVYFLLPPAVYLLLFRHELLHRLLRLRDALAAVNAGTGNWAQVLERATEDEPRLIDLDGVAHMCSERAEHIREEVDKLLADLQLRLKRCLFAGFSTAFLSIFLPLVFVPFKTSVEGTQQLLIPESWQWQMAAVVFCTAFTHYVTYLFPLTYLDLFYRSAMHLGSWKPLPPLDGVPSPSSSSSPPSAVLRRPPPAPANHIPLPPSEEWSPAAKPYPDGSVVHLGDGSRWRAVATSPLVGRVAARPGYSSHARFTALCSHHLSLMNWLVVAQLALIAVQFWLLVLTTEWQHIVTLVLLMFANYLLLAKLFKDRVIVSRIYEPSPEDLALIDQVRQETASRREGLRRP